MENLADFLLDRIAEDKAGERGVGKWYPARIQAECEAKRRILDISQGITENPDHAECLGLYLSYEERDALALLKALALPYADHPDYREEWRP